MTGLPQGFPISPVLSPFTSLTSTQRWRTRSRTAGASPSWTTSHGRDVGEVIRKLEQCAEASLTWAEGNAVRFETSKTEAILPSKKRAHRRCDSAIQVGPDHPLRSRGHPLAGHLARLSAYSRREPPTPQRLKTRGSRSPRRSGAPSVKARYSEGTIKPPSVVLAAADEDTRRLV